jgi:HEAT repeat protein
VSFLNIAILFPDLSYNNFMKYKKLLRYASLVLALMFGIILIFVIATFSIIYLEVRNVCTRAISEYSKDCIDSLVLTLESEDKSFKEKNDAIWVLGQLADERALPALVKLQTGEVPEREPLDEVISQYEIRKAIHWINDGNATSWMYINFN